MITNEKLLMRGHHHLQFFFYYYISLISPIRCSLSVINFENYLLNKREMESDFVIVMFIISYIYVLIIIDNQVNIDNLFVLLRNVY